MRSWLAVIVMIGLPVAVAAQSRTLPPGEFLPLPQIGLPLPQLGLPLPPTGFPPSSTVQPHSRGVSQPRRPHPDRQRTFIYVVPTYGWGYPFAPDVRTATPGYREPSNDQPQTPRPGTLRLDVQPERTLQLYVDGYYVGTPEDFNRELELESGAHKIEIRAPGYETLTFDVNIPPDGSITYRGALKAVNEVTVATPETPAFVAASPTKPTTFYFIPGCYMGNIPPPAAELPATCDQSRVVTFER